MNRLLELVPSLRAKFPSLQRLHEPSHGPVVYLDGPAGSQVPRSVVDAIGQYYLHHNANSGGTFATSLETSAIMAKAHEAAADWFGASYPRECIFGPNMTSLTFAFSRALANTWRSGDRIVVTELDHDANVTPWKLAARDVGAQVETVRISRENATLDVDDFRRCVKPGVKLVAFTCASNSVGSRTPIRELVEIAHQAGAEVYLDAVHYAPHDLIDVGDWDADYCVCSGYKFFGPHVGLLWGRHTRLEELAPYKLRPAPEHCPGKWMTGTQNFAAIAGVTAAIDYVAHIGQQLDDTPRDSQLDNSRDSSHRQALRRAFAAIGDYERELAAALIEGLKKIEGVTLYGITDPADFAQRVPTVVFNLAGLTSREVAARLAAQGIFCWHGDYYAVDVCAALGRQPHGMVRMGLLHTNTLQEVERTIAAVSAL